MNPEEFKYFGRIEQPNAKKEQAEKSRLDGLRSRADWMVLDFLENNQELLKINPGLKLIADKLRENNSGLEDLEVYDPFGNFAGAYDPHNNKRFVNRSFSDSAEDRLVLYTFVHETFHVAELPDETEVDQLAVRACGFEPPRGLGYEDKRRQLLSFCEQHGIEDYAHEVALESVDLFSNLAVASIINSFTRTRNCEAFKLDNMEQAIRILFSDLQILFPRRWAELKSIYGGDPLTGGGNENLVDAILAASQIEIKRRLKQDELLGATVISKIVTELQFADWGAEKLPQMMIHHHGLGYLVDEIMQQLQDRIEAADSFVEPLVAAV